jgi:hypothetical protein
VQQIAAELEARRKGRVEASHGAPPRHARVESEPAFHESPDTWWMTDEPEPTLPEWREFERLVAAVQRALDPKASITWDDQIPDSRGVRQVDVHLESRVGTAAVRVLIECRRYEKKVGVGQVEAWATKSRTLGAHKAMMVTSSGYTSGALGAAADYGIDLYVLKRADDADWEGYLRAFRIVLQMIVPRYTDIALIDKTGARIEVNQFAQIIIGSERTFVDRLLATIAHRFEQEHGPATAEPRAISANEFTERLALIKDSGEIEIEAVQFAHSVVPGVDPITIDQTSPKDWVFFKVTASGVHPEKHFFEFRELREIAATFRKGEKQSPGDG